MAANGSNMKELYDTTKDWLVDPFLKFTDFTEDDETFILRALKNHMGGGIRFSVGQLEEMHADLAVRLSRRKNKEITPLMVKERLVIMKTRLKLFQTSWAHPGVLFNTKYGRVKLHPIKYPQFCKQPIWIDKRFAERGFRNYDRFCYCFQIKKLPIQEIKVVTKFDRFDMGVTYDSE